MGHVRTSSEKVSGNYSGGIQAGRKCLLEKMWGPFIVVKGQINTLESALHSSSHTSPGGPNGTVMVPSYV